MRVIPYRRDIDGLRAVAVMSVVLFHAGFDALSGGYVGVDIFFVISGYLIGAIVLKELEWGSFTFRSFYERRVRRILPALFLVLIATAVAGYFLLLPDEYAALGEASLATLFFGSNIYFWDKKSTYFGLDINTEPLLHTWSLGVEEQFYLFFPLILWALYRRGLRQNQLFMVFSLLFVASFALNLFATPFYTKFSFYMIPTRAWELMLGVLLALGVLPDVRRPGLATILALTGAGLVIGAVVFLDEASLFPGVNAVYPVFGAALIIYAGRKQVTWVHRLLEQRVLVYLGLISYSLYLWHWPVTIYTNMLWDSPYAKLWIVAVSVLLAVLSYHLVENRYRGRSAKARVNEEKRKRGLGEVGFNAAMVFVIAMTLVVTDGIPGRVPDRAYELVGIDRVRLDPMKSSGACRIFDENPHNEGDKKGYLCHLGETGGAPEFVIWGDSHARALIPALRAAAQEAGIAGIALTNSGCRPLVGVYRESKSRCLHFNQAVIDYIAAQPAIRKVFLVGYWRVPLMGKSYDNNNFLIMDDQTRDQSPEENRQVFRRGLDRTLQALGDIDAFIVEDVPEVGARFGKSVSNHFVRMAWYRGEVDERLHYEDIPDDYAAHFSDVLASLEYPYHWVEIKDELCDSTICPLMGDGHMIYFDGDHLSEFGALRLATRFEELLVATGDSDRGPVEADLK
jgi:peptidoglycan/LPS O-acetylase OafA/YrhL